MARKIAALAIGVFALASLVGCSHTTRTTRVEPSASTQTTVITTQPAPTVVTPPPAGTQIVTTPSTSTGTAVVAAPPARTTVVTNPPARTTLVTPSGQTVIIPKYPWCEGAYAPDAGTNFGSCGPR